MTEPSKAADAWNPWSIYIDAREEARRRGDRKVGTEHLVLGLLRDPAIAQALETDLPTARETLDAMDREALAAVGIGAGVDAPPIPIPEPVTRSPKAAFKASLQDRLPMTPAAKAAMEHAHRELRRRHGVGSRQVLLAILELTPPDPAAELITALGVDGTVTRERLAVRTT